MTYNEFNVSFIYENNTLFLRNIKEPIAIFNNNKEIFFTYEDEVFSYIEEGGDSKKLFTLKEIKEMCLPFREIKPWKILRYLNMMINGNYHEFDIDTDEQNRYGIIGYNGKNKNVVFPSVYEGINIEFVSRIDNDNIESVEFENGIKEIKKDAFNYCLNLRKVKLNDDLRSLNISSFDVDKVEHKIEYGMHYIDNWLVYADYVEKTVFEVRDGIVGIVDGFFVSCPQVERIIIPNTIKYIDESILNSELEFISYRGTYDEWMKINRSEEIFSNIDILFKNHKRINTKKYTYYLDNSNRIFSLRSIEDEVFGDIDLEKEFKDYEIISIGSSGFSNNNSLFSLKMPDSVLRIGESAFANSKFLQNVKLSNNLTVINNNTFKNCYSLSVINLPENLKEIKESSFNNCKNLTGFDFPSKLVKINRKAFYKCSKIRIITIPENVEHVGAEAFAFCMNLNSITFENEMSEIKQGLAFHCENLTHVILPNNLKVINEMAFTGTALNLIEVNMTSEEWEKVEKKNLMSRAVRVKFLK